MKIAAAAAVILAVLHNPAQAAEKEAAPGSRPSAAIAAVVNGVPISVYDITPPNIEKVVHGSDKEAQIEQIKKVTLLRKIMYEVLYQEAERAKTPVPQNMLQRMLNSQILEAGGLLTFVRKLKQRRQSYADFVRELRREITIHVFLSKFTQSRSKTMFFDSQAQDLVVPPEEIRNYYDDNPKEFLREKKGAVRIIVIYAQDHPSAAEAEAHARKAHAEAKQGEDFAGLAKKYSGVRSQQGGLFHLSGDSGLKEELATLVAGMAEGEISDVVKLGQTFNILKLEEKKEMVTVPFEEVQDAIKDKVRRKAIEKEQRLLVNKLLERASIVPRELMKDLMDQD